MFKQLNLSFEPKFKFNEHDLYFGNYNREAIFWLNKWPNWPNDYGLIIYGEAGLGKTCLAQSWCNKSAAALLNKKNINLLPDLINNPHCHIVLDNLDLMLSSNLCTEADLLHLINSNREYGYHILITCQDVNFINQIFLRDLSSRLALFTIIPISIPDNIDLHNILRRTFDFKQIVVHDQTLKYLSCNLPRSFKAVRLIIDWLDQTALVKHSKISIELAKEGINKLFSSNYAE